MPLLLQKHLDTISLHHCGDVQDLPTLGLGVTGVCFYGCLYQEVSWSFIFSVASLV